MLTPGHGARQVINKMHVSSQTCPQATSQERKVYVSLVPSVPENCTSHRIASEHGCRYPSQFELCLDKNQPYPSWPPDVNAILSDEDTYRVVYRGSVSGQL